MSGLPQETLALLPPEIVAFLEEGERERGALLLQDLGVPGCPVCCAARLREAWTPEQRENAEVYAAIEGTED